MTGFEAAHCAIAVRNVLEQIVSALIEPYADHPDYDESWRP